MQRAFGGLGGSSGITCGDAMVARIAADGASIPYFTYLGGGRDEMALGIAVDAQGNDYVTGYTLSENFPTSAGAYQTTYRGTSGQSNWNSGDAFVTKIAPA